MLISEMSPIIRSLKGGETIEKEASAAVGDIRDGFNNKTQSRFCRQ